MKYYYVVYRFARFPQLFISYLNVIRQYQVGNLPSCGLLEDRISRPVLSRIHVIYVSLQFIHFDIDV
jgi:hypothetical protein